MAKSDTLRVRMEPEEMEWVRAACTRRGTSPSALVRHQLEPIVAGAKIAAIAAEFETIEGVILFGSMARFEQDEKSDVDLLVKASETVSWLADGGLGSFRIRVEDALGRAVDIVTPRSCRRELADAIAAEGRVVYAR